MNLCPDTLLCPDCRSVLSQHSDSIECPQCSQTWPIRSGIPRFVTDEHLASFGLQWNRYDVAHDDEDRATFAAKTGVSLEELNGLNVLDAGCGGGRYCRVAAAAGARVTGADHSCAVDKAAQLCAGFDNVRLVQADLKRLPFPPRSFDFVFSIGVMHHDRDTRAVFDAVAPMVRPGGRLSVWLYRRNTAPQEWLNTWLRKHTTRWPARRLEWWCRLAAFPGGLPLIRQTLSKIINFSTHPVRENRICDNFDWYAPEWQHHHTTEELTSWFRDAGFRDLRVLPPERQGRFYRWAWRSNLIIGSGVNVTGIRAADA